MRVKFIADYDHTWPSRAVTAFKAGMERTVKTEVGEAAVAAGKAEELPAATAPAKRGKPADTLPGNLPAALAEPQALTPNLHVDDTGNSK